jgi:hypothetical protein
MCHPQRLRLLSHSHAAVASCHLGDEGSTVTAVVRDAYSAPVSPKMKALLAIAARVQRNGRDVRESDIARARAEGATDIEIHDAVLIAAAFCMFNRYVDGLGALTPTDAAGYRDRARYVAEHGYAAILPSCHTFVMHVGSWRWDVGSWALGVGN